MAETFFHDRMETTLKRLVPLFNKYCETLDGFTKPLAEAELNKMIGQMQNDAKIHDATCEALAKSETRIAELLDGDPESEPLEAKSDEQT